MRLTRLSPRSLFLGIVALGLPFAVAVGWALGDPAAPPPPAAAPAGAGFIGTAPARASSPPVTAVELSSRTSRMRAGRSTPAATRAVPRPRTSSSSAPPASPPSAPATTAPPAPTSTAVPSAPPSPSATPSGSVAPEPTGVGLIRR